VTEEDVNEQERRRKRRILIWAVGVTAIVVCLGYWVVGLYQKGICMTKIAVLGKAMMVYATDNDGKFPPPDNWCDALLEALPNTPEKLFQCPGGGGGRCHYAMNPNAEPNSPNNTVLLFETRAGWNQSGGPELWTFENHRGKGCSVVFVGTGPVSE
jgi:hypothetical protein